MRKNTHENSGRHRRLASAGQRRGAHARPRRARGARARRRHRIPDAGGVLDAADAELSGNPAGAAGAGRRSSGGSIAARRTPFTSRPKARSAMPCAASACGARCRSPPASTPAFPIISPSGCRCRSAGPATWPGPGCGVSMRPGAAVLAATPTLRRELDSRGFHDVKLWPRGVDARSVPAARRRARSICRGRFFSPSGGWRWKKTSKPSSSSICPAPSSWSATGRRARSWQRHYPDAVFLGARQGEALAEIYAAADVFVFPSRTDTFGLVLLEALASGVPVAAFPAAGAARRDRRSAGRRARRGSCGAPAWPRWNARARTAATSRWA